MRRTKLDKGTVCVFEDGTAPLNTLTTSSDGALGPRHPVPMCRWCRCLGLAPKLAFLRPPTPNQGGAPHPSSCLLSLEPDMKGLQTKWGVVIFRQINKVTGAKLFLSYSVLCCMGVVLQNDSAVLRGAQPGQSNFLAPSYCPSYFSFLFFFIFLFSSGSTANLL